MESEEQEELIVVSESESCDDEVELLLSVYFAHIFA